MENIAILTGDVVNSRAIAPQQWMPLLKETLFYFGNEPKEWEVYRGDSFQLQTRPALALTAALTLKATLKELKGLDVRIAIGIGDKSYDAQKITEANGTAFVYSGQCFQHLKKLNLAIATQNKTFDQTMNLMFKLASLTMDNWQPATARVVKTALLQPEASQVELATLLGKSQSTISEALLRAGYDEINQLLNYYKQYITNL
ncbi:transcriptional regulator [Croceivirga sp. JEA036]|uniref:transcriptional regulator n=1 Tax=Croceivirga sp. JEA036 TaxID=2721162 RepID=UPI001439BA77|nr:transcriptional regulator [Croceivirga sp. JEA036]NJB37862.1 transcriptional regulator [Croceivirga sp. JEA036]